MPGIGTITGVPNTPGPFQVDGFTRPWFNPVKNWTLTGQTQDANGLPFPLCLVYAFRSSDHLLVASGGSDLTGTYTLTIPSLYATTDLYVLAYQTGSPDAKGVTVNTLRPV